MAASKDIDVKQTILQTTISLLGDTPFDEITLAKIARTSKISKGTLYYYYNNKDDILFDITQHVLRTLAADFTAWADNKDKDTSPRRLIGYVLQKGAGMGLGNLRLYLAAAAVSGHHNLRQKYIELYDWFQKTIELKLAARLPHADATYFSWLLLTTMDGILIQNQLQNPHFDSAGFIEKTTNLLCE